MPAKVKIREDTWAPSHNTMLNRPHMDFLTCISRSHLVPEVFCLNLEKPHPRRTAGAGGQNGIPRSGGLRLCLKTCAGGQKVGSRHGEEPNYGVCKVIIARTGFSCSSFSSFTVQKAVLEPVLLIVLESQGHWRTMKIVFLLYDDKAVHGTARARACGDMQGHDACWNSTGLVAWARQIWHKLIHTVCKMRTLGQSLMPDLTWICLTSGRSNHSKFSFGSSMTDQVICFQAGLYLAILPAEFPEDCYCHNLIVVLMIWR